MKKIIFILVSVLALSCQRVELPEMVEIPGGSFIMGDAEASGFNYDETPAHSVTVSGFAMSKFEITNRQFEAFRPEHAAMRGDEGFSSGDDEAVVNVTWKDAIAYCEWLSAAGITSTAKCPAVSPKTRERLGHAAPVPSPASAAARGTFSCA